MFSYKDFTPTVEKGGLFRNSKVGSLQEVVATANEWAAMNSVDVINIETVLLPVPIMDPSKGFERTGLKVDMGGAKWTQIVRLWFRE